MVFLRVLRDLCGLVLTTGSGAKDFYRIAVNQDCIMRFDLAVNGRLHIPGYRQPVNNIANRAARHQREYSPAIGRQFLAQNAVKSNLNLDFDVCTYGSQLFHTSSWASTQAWAASSTVLPSLSIASISIWASLP